MTFDVASIESSGETFRCPHCHRWTGVLAVRRGRPRLRRLAGVVQELRSK
jgi:hypothetical protein